jgi:iron complex outermembrane receptor protein
MKIALAIFLFFYALLISAEEDTTKLKNYKSTEIIVLDDYFGINDKDIEETINSTEDILKQQNEIDLISRANFASEAVVRGYTQDRLNVTIDGMRLFSACIDKMDPITSYIEVENLSKTEVNSDKSSLMNGISTGGSLNFITNKPSHNQSLRFISDNQFNSVSDAYNSRGSTQYGSESIATMASYSVKRSSDYKAGDNSTINNSSYSKENVKFNLNYKSDEDINHSLEYIYDHSADVFYPALIMDTRYTHMNMASYDFNIDNIGESIYDFNTNLYFNMVEHLMDDYDRSDEEINNRLVMPGMYMPMYGETKTFGLNSSIKQLLSDGILSLSFEGYNMNAFADMDMEMLDTDEKMYLTNLGDINTTKLGLSVGYIASLNNKTTYSINSRYDISYRTMNNDFSKAITESF